jgi:hypothetical protein
MGGVYSRIARSWARMAIDIEAIKSRVMRGLSTPTALLISPLLFARAGEFAAGPMIPLRPRSCSRMPDTRTGSR